MDITPTTNTERVCCRIGEQLSRESKEAKCEQRIPGISARWASKVQCGIGKLVAPLYKPVGVASFKAFPSGNLTRAIYVSGVIQALYKEAVHAAVVSSDGRDAYTGEELDWELIKHPQERRFESWKTELQVRFCPAANRRSR
jgi:hypothetical protein